MIDISHIPEDRLLSLYQEIERQNEAEKEKEKWLTDDAYFEQYFEQDKIGKPSWGFYNIAMQNGSA